ncbi:MAG: DUF5694 domain-containing protein [Bacteroidota bacterium]
MVNIRNTVSLFLFVVTFSSLTISQATESSGKAKVMTLGVFHFNFPNLDAQKIDDKDKIDVLEEKHQKEIAKITDALKEFMPTCIVIEVQPASQKRIDSLYKAYRLGKHTLGRSEIEQLGFRIANDLKIEKLECVDTWGKLYENLEYLSSDTSSRAKAFEHYYFNNPDTIYKKKKKGISLSTASGITDNLLYLNDPQTIKESLGSYLIGHFKYEEKEGDYTGVDFETGRWFNRNLRIFRNIQKITKSSSDRILIIYGAGHLNILNYLFESSPEYELVGSESFLRKAK